MEGMQQDASHRDLTFLQGFKAQIEKHLLGMMCLGFSWARAGLQIQPGALQPHPALEATTPQARARAARLFLISS